MSEVQDTSFLLGDTLTRLKQKVFAEDGDVLRFYCCGPTVYGPAHIGNFRTFVAQDLFRRVAEGVGLATRHVRNLTDVDDKTIRDSQSAGESLKAFTDRWRDRFHEDCAALNLLVPHEEPSAVAHVEQQVELIESLIEKGHAYVGEDGSAYFRISSFPEYGRLSRLKERELARGAGGRTTTDDEYSKETVGDFALWKARRPDDGDNFWPSPWGEGRPGWHLECSAMCREYLGDSFDLHSGGEDLVFPHHENEIAQSECATGKTFARHWFHVSHLLVDGGKMSKSLGNFHTLADLAAKGYGAELVRYVLLSGHYRQSLNFTFASLDAADSALGKLAKTHEALGGGEPPSYEESLGLGGCALGPFAPAWEALLDDLNVPKALGALFSALKELWPDKLDDVERAATRNAFWFVLNVLGIRLPEKPEATEVPEEVLELAERRLVAKQAKDWGTADALREEIASTGWQVKDRPDGYDLEPK